jgi:hypothetical protein
VTIGAPTAVSPLSGTIVNGWPTLTVSNATRTVQTGALVYRFEIATDAGFSSIIVRGTVSETANQTRFAPPGQPLPVQTNLFWRATATDQSTGTSSPASAVQSYTSNITPQSQLAALEGISLWSDIQPPGSNGRATLGDSWNVQNVVAFPSGVVHVTPTVDELRVFDLLDRGLDPQGAIDWMNSHGYRTNAAVYASVNVIGFDFEYMAFVRGRWDLVFKIE